MRIVIRQNLRGGPCDGEMKRAFVRVDFDAEVWVPVRFDDCGIPTVTALYIADVSQDLIKDGELDLRFYGYYRASRLQREVYKKHSEAQTNGN